MRLTDTSPETFGFALAIGETSVAVLVGLFARTVAFLDALEAAAIWSMASASALAAAPGPHQIPRTR